MACLVADCDTRVVAHGYCDRHYRRWKLHGDPLLGRRENVPKRHDCSVDGCDLKPFAAGLCGPHYGRLQRHGDALAGAVRRQKPPEDGRCTIPDCGRPHYRRGYCAAHNRRFREYGDPLGGEPIRDFRPKGMTLAEAFAYFMPGNPPKYCWEWTGKVAPNGYGILNMGTRSLMAHRVSYELAVGSIPEGQMILHSCDNRRCVNPNHLRPGSHMDNMIDRQIRLRTPRGRKIPQAKLNEDQVREIRKLCINDVRYPVIARQFGVSTSTIQAVAAHKNWKHVV